ncbi:MAG: PAS domain-containing protein [Geobacteraceae bacterium]|nr:PAS domain-containing protein [Geobacteraceae bacterium]
MDSCLTDRAFTELNDQIINLLDSFSALSMLSSLDIRYPNLDTILRKALRGLMENMDMERCSIFLLQKDQLVNCVGLDWDDILLGAAEESVSRHSVSLDASIGEGIMGLAVQTKTLQHCRDCSSDERFKAVPGHAIGSLISVPIFQPGGEILGVLNVSHPRALFFTEWHERLLVVYCNCLGQLIINHRLVTQMDREIEKRTSLLMRTLEEVRTVEKGLRESEEQLNLVLEGSNDGFWDWSLVNREVRLSHRWAGILGYTLPEVNQRFQDGIELIHPEDAPAVRAMIAKHLEGSLPHYSFEYRMQTRNGEWKWIMDRGKVVEWDDLGKPLRMTGTTSDVSDRRWAEEEKQRLENQLNHSQKMEAIGQLAGGVAHEFNNIMTAIIGYGHLMVMKTEEHSPLRHFAAQILTSAERASALTRSLLTFSRKQISNPHHVNVNEAIEKMGKLMSRLIREDIEFRTELADSELIILADDGQLEQVLMNLVTNARDAMPSGGLVFISTGLEELRAESIPTFGPGKTGTFVRISVIDSGIGMDEITREKIFEPFFTTKEPGKGTGLGLAIVYGIIKQQNGFIRVSSKQGEGTEVSLYFPLVQGVEGQTDAASSSPMKTGTETILIAEDDHDLRRLNRELFEECGYCVLEAANGKEALELFLKYQDVIDLLVFDVIMPKMNGKEVFEEIRTLRPDIRVLFTSGYTGDILNSSSGIGSEFDFIAKPQPPDEFMGKVREILDRPRV